MKYISYYDSPVGKLYLTADGKGLTGIAYEHEDGNTFPMNIRDVKFSDNLPVIIDTKLWLELYFSGNNPGFMPKLSIHDSPFREQVWKVLKTIPYGQSMSYGEVASIVAKQRKTKASPQAVGGALAHNPIAIILPCHRVLGADGGITGYNGGIEVKKYLLDLEKINYIEK
ncbi:MAG: methylated-DNA--[protein]-cysteine S-methyltransferase [Anaerovibrio sp.]|nr:methylated-DNA--[protein]-cysteine S-methyltransferase [Anaerovibrio sp.]